MQPLQIFKALIAPSWNLHALFFILLTQVYWRWLYTLSMDSKEIFFKDLI